MTRSSSRLILAVGCEACGSRYVMKWLFLPIAVAFILSGFLVWRFAFGEVFSAAALAQLKSGMTTNEVIAILGQPSSIANGHWVYQRPLMYNVGIVFFDSDRVRTAIND